MATTETMDFTLKTQVQAPALWGARLLLEEGSKGETMVSLLSDRQTLNADSPEARAALVAALDGKTRGEGAIAVLLAYLTRHVKREDFDLGGRAPIGPVILRSVEFRGNPNGSHGYIYVVGLLATDVCPTCDGCGKVHAATIKAPICGECRELRKGEERERKRAEAYDKKEALRARKERAEQFRRFRAPGY